MKFVVKLGLSLISGLLVVLLISFVAVKMYYPDVYDDSLVTGNPCLLPCWHNLKVGQSTEAEVQTELAQNAAILPASIETVHSPLMLDTYSVEWDWRSTRHSGGYLIFTKAGLLDEIRLNPDKSVTAQKILSAYGAPDLIVYYAVWPFNDLFGASPGGVRIDMVYFKKNFELSWFEETPQESWTLFCPNLDLPISFITVYRANNMNVIRDKWSLGKTKTIGAAAYQASNGKVNLACTPVTSDS